MWLSEQSWLWLNNHAGHSCGFTLMHRTVQVCFFPHSVPRINLDKSDFSSLWDWKKERGTGCNGSQVMASLTSSPSQEGSPRMLRMCTGFPHHVREAGGLSFLASLPLQVTPGGSNGGRESRDLTTLARSLVICKWVYVSALSDSNIAFVLFD